MNESFVILHHRGGPPGAWRRVVRLGAISAILDDGWEAPKADILLDNGRTIEAEETIDEIMDTLRQLADGERIFRTVT